MAMRKRRVPRDLLRLPQRPCSRRARMGTHAGMIQQSVAILNLATWQVSNQYNSN